MAAFFVDTASVASTIPLSSHTTDSGHTWAYFAGETGVPNVYPSFGKVIACGSTGYKAWRSSVASPTPDVVVDQDWYVDSWSIAQSFGPCARMNAAGNKGYGAVFITTSKKWLIVRIGASMATTTLATSATMGYTATGIYSVSLKVTGIGASISLELSVGGSVVLTATDTGASRITDAGYVGFWMQMGAADAGAFIDSMSADTPGGGATVVSTSLAGAWSARNAASSSAAGSWSVRSLVGASANGAWSVRNLSPAASLPGAWSIEAAGLASASLPGSWSVRNAAQASISGAWAVRNSAASALSGAWSVDAPGAFTVGASIAGAWSVAAYAASSLAGAWSVAGTATAYLSGSWRVRGEYAPEPESLYLSVASANTHLSKASGAQYLSIARI